MILVTGATGTTGRLVLDRLLAGGHPARGMTRSLDRLRGAPGVQADYDEPAALAGAVHGADAIYLVTTAPDATTRYDEALLDTARAAGVRTVVRLSAIGSGDQFDGGTVGAWHAGADDLVRASGLRWTVLRPTSFASNTLSWATAIRDGQPVPNLTGDATTGVVDPRDVADVAVAALTSDAHHGRTYTLTGPDLLSVPDQAAQLSDVLGRPVRHTDTSPDLVPAAWRLGVRYARAGHAAVLTTDVADVLGRPAGAFRDWAIDHRDAFRA